MTRWAMPALWLCMLVLTSVTACGMQDTKTAAKCAGARSMFSVSQDKVINAGLCDAYDTVSDCPAHVALRESLVLALSEAGCGS